MFRKIATTLVCLVSLGGVAFGSSGQGNKGGPGQNPSQGSIPAPSDNQCSDQGAQTGGVPILNLSFDQFKQFCEAPEQFNRQRQPYSIQISCDNRATEWEMVDAGAVPLGRRRTILGALRSDKVCVSEQPFNVSVAPVTGSCPRFKEVLRTYSTARSITCDDVLQHKDEDLGQFCLGILDEEIAMNQQLVSEVDTGLVVDTCQLTPASAPASMSSPKGYGK